MPAGARKGAKSLFVEKSIGLSRKDKQPTPI
jgi:hypothetical protein